MQLRSEHVRTYIKLTIPNHHESQVSLHSQLSKAIFWPAWEPAWLSSASLLMWANETFHYLLMSVCLWCHQFWHKNQILGEGLSCLNRMTARLSTIFFKTSGRKEISWKDMWQFLILMKGWKTRLRNWAHTKSRQVLGKSASIMPQGQSGWNVTPGSNVTEYLSLSALLNYDSTDCQYCMKMFPYTNIIRSPFWDSNLEVWAF